MLYLDLLTLGHVDRLFKHFSLAKSFQKHEVAVPSCAMEGRKHLAHLKHAMDRRSAISNPARVTPAHPSTRLR